MILKKILIVSLFLNILCFQKSLYSLGIVSDINQNKSIFIKDFEKTYKLKEINRSYEDYFKLKDKSYNELKAFWAFVRAEYYFKYKEYENALEDYNMVLSFNGSIKQDSYKKLFKDVISKKLDIYIKLNKYQNIIDEYSAALNCLQKKYDVVLKAKLKEDSKGNSIKEYKYKISNLYYYFGCAYQGLKENKTAFENYTKSIEMDNENIKTYFNRGKLLLYWNEKEKEAIDDFSKVISLDFKEKYNLVYSYMGMCYAKLDLWDKAFEYCNKTVKMCRKNKEITIIKTAYGVRGELFFEKKYFAKACKDFKKILEIEPYDFYANKYVGEILFSQKKYDNAKKYLDLAYKKNKKDKDVIMWSSIIFFEKNDFSSAETILKKAVSDFPNYYPFYGFLAKVYFYLCKYEDALKECNKVLEKSNKKIGKELIVELYQLKAHTFLRLAETNKKNPIKYYNNAISNFKKAIQNGGLSECLYYDYACTLKENAKIYYKQQKIKSCELFNESKAYYLRAYKLNPKRLRINENIGFINIMLANYDFSKNINIAKAFYGYIDALEKYKIDIKQMEEQKKGDCKKEISKVYKKIGDIYSAIANRFHMNQNRFNAIREKRSEYFYSKANELYEKFVGQNSKAADLNRIKDVFSIAKGIAGEKYKINLVNNKKSIYENNIKIFENKITESKTKVVSFEKKIENNKIKKIGFEKEIKDEKLKAKNIEKNIQIRKAQNEKLNLKIKKNKKEIKKYNNIIRQNKKEIINIESNKNYEQKNDLIKQETKLIKDNNDILNKLIENLNKRKVNIDQQIDENKQKIKLLSENKIKIDEKISAIQKNVSKNKKELIKFKNKKSKELDAFSVLSNSCGYAFFMLGKYEKAIKFYKEIEEKNPILDAYINWAELEYQRKNYETVLEKGKNAQDMFRLFNKMEIKSKKINLYEIMAKTYFRLEKFEDAVKYCDLIFKLNSRNWNIYVLKAEVLLKSKKYDEALKTFEQAETVYKESEEVINDLGKLYLGKGIVRKELKQYEKALESYNEALKIDNVCRQAFEKSIEVFELQGRDEDVKKYKKIIYVLYEEKIKTDIKSKQKAKKKIINKEEIDKKNIDNFIKNDKGSLENIISICTSRIIEDETKDKGFFYKSLGDIYNFKLNKYKKALGNYMYACKYTNNEDKLLLYYKIGEVYYEMAEMSVEDIDKIKYYLLAETNFLKTIKDGKTNFQDVYFKLGNIYMKLFFLEKENSNIKKVEEYFIKAKTYYNKTLEKHPGALPVYQNIGCLYYEKGEYQNAINLYDKSIKIVRNPNAYLYRGKAYEALENNTEALRDYNEAINLAESNNLKFPEASLAKGKYLLKQKKYKEALPSFQNAFSQNEINPELKFYIAKTYYLQGKYGKAESACKEVIILNIQYFQNECCYIYELLWKIYKKLKKVNKKEKEYQLCLETGNEKVGEAYKMLFELYNKEKRFNGIEDIYQKIIKLNPNQADFYYNLGILYFGVLGRYDKARKQFETAISLDKTYETKVKKIKEHCFKENRIKIFFNKDEIIFEKNEDFYELKLGKTKDIKNININETGVEFILKQNKKIWEKIEVKKELFNFGNIIFAKASKINKRFMAVTKEGVEGKICLVIAKPKNIDKKGNCRYVISKGLYNQINALKGTGLDKLFYYMLNAYIIESSFQDEKSGNEKSLINDIYILIKLAEYAEKERQKDEYKDLDITEIFKWLENELNQGNLSLEKAVILKEKVDANIEFMEKIKNFV